LGKERRAQRLVAGGKPEEGRGNFANSGGERETGAVAGMEGGEHRQEVIRKRVG